MFLVPFNTMNKNKVEDTKEEDLSKGYARLGHVFSCATLGAGVATLCIYTVLQGHPDPQTVYQQMSYDNLVEGYLGFTSCTISCHVIATGSYIQAFKRNIKNGYDNLKGKMVSAGRFTKELSSSLLDKFKNMVNPAPAYAEQTL